jgi:hypothetical protein
MATRTSTRTTKAVKFVDSAESDEEEEFTKPSPVQAKPEGKKSRGRPPNSRRNRTDDDDDEWIAESEQVENEDDNNDDDEESDHEGNETRRDVTKKFPANRSTNSVYDFG